jgi:hypothetical protein
MLIVVVMPSTLHGQPFLLVSPTFGDKTAAMFVVASSPSCFLLLASATNSPVKRGLDKTSWSIFSTDPVSAPCMVLGA